MNDETTSESSREATEGAKYQWEFSSLGEVAADRGEYVGTSNVSIDPRELNSLVNSRGAIFTFEVPTYSPRSASISPRDGEFRPVLAPSVPSRPEPEAV